MDAQVFSIGGRPADGQVEPTLALVHLGDGLPADRCLNHGIDIADVQTIAATLLPIGRDSNVGLPQRREKAEVLDAFDRRHHIDDLVGLLLVDAEVGADHFDGVLALDA